MKPDLDAIEARRRHVFEQVKTESFEDDVYDLLEEDIPALLAYCRELEADKARLDWLQAQSDPDYGWIARNSTMDRGYRLHQTTRNEARSTVREALDTGRSKP